LPDVASRAILQRSMTWVVYVLRSCDGRRTYVGITSDLPRRLSQHNGELPGGAKSTRAGRPWTVGRQHGPFDSRGDALRLEATIKRRPGRKRLEILEHA
jgi:predicted GIY-YIG superfamily endonuclease